VTAILLIALPVLFALGVPIAFGLGLATSLALLYGGSVPLIVVAQRMFTSLDSFPIMAVLLFMLAGSIMDEGGMARRIIAFAGALLGEFRASLAMIAVGATMLISGVSGSGTADTAAVGSVMIPAMMKRGYEPRFVTAIQAAAGALGPIIPPSIIMVVLGSVTNTSIGQLFIGGIIPGLIIGGFLMVVCYVHARRGGAAYEATETFSWGRVWTTFWQAIPGLGMAILILGGILTGVFTATESAVMGVVYGFLVGLFVYRELRLRQLPRMLVDAACRSAIILIIIGTAGLFAWLIANLQIPTVVGRFLQDTSANWIVFMILVNLLLLLLGMFMESIAVIIVLMPILYPVAQSFGIDLLHFGVVVSVNLSIGLVTPPYGATLFVACSIAKMTIREVTPALLPALFVMVIAQVLITFIPPLTTWLPRLFIP
jgi:C4-dicarboxylate transporter DctM subunit